MAAAAAMEAHLAEVAERLRPLTQSEGETQ